MLPIENTKLFGFRSLEKSIFTDFLKNKLHHSLLITGAKGIGKATFAYKIANKILSTKEKDKNILLSKDIEIKDLSPFNQTFKLINSKAHPDFFVIEREINPKTKKIEKAIKVDAIRKINEFINLTPSLSDYKVIIIDSADEMNINAQNAILKTLEEPNDNSFIILISHNTNKLLDTIKSRCRMVQVKPIDYKDWKNAISNCLNGDNVPKLDEEEFQMLSVISDNSVSFALNIIELDGLEFYERILNILVQDKPNIEEIQTFASVLKDNSSLFNLFKFFINFFFERIIKFSLNQKIDTFTSENEQKAIEIIAIKNESDSIFGKFEYIKQIFSDIERKNLDKKHSIGVLFNEILS
jgi:DNA polymerase-3 subunit delta'